MHSIFVEVSQASKKEMIRRFEQLIDALKVADYPCDAKRTSFDSGETIFWRIATDEQEPLSNAEIRWLRFMLRSFGLETVTRKIDGVP